MLNSEKDKMDSIEYETERLVLRNWRESDKPLFAQMSSDPIVMEYFPALRTQQECNAIADKCISRIAENGFGFWAVDRKDSNEFIGFVGLSSFAADLPFCPCVEIGWSLARAHWRQGFAAEAARKSLEIGFVDFDLPEIYSFTALQNSPSRGVMKKIGMENTRENFMHPNVAAQSGLQEHCLFRITKNNWLKQQSGTKIGLVI